MWFRRDLRLSDNPALAAAARHVGAGGEVVALFCLDPRLERPAGRGSPCVPGRAASPPSTTTSGAGSSCGPGRPESVVPAVAAEAGADVVFVAEDFGPYGRERDEPGRAGARRARRARWSASGRPTRCRPARCAPRPGDPYKVFTPFSRAWRAHGWPDPSPAPGRLTWAAGARRRGGARPARGRRRPPRARRGRGARGRCDGSSTAGSTTTPRSATGPTSTPPRACRPTSSGAASTPASCWPGSGAARRTTGSAPSCAGASSTPTCCGTGPTRSDRRSCPAMRGLQVDSGTTTDERFRAWADGRTGYPIVDAGMRQLAAEGWMHNRVRMIVASFLVKDLHLDWTRGARYFMEHLVDGDLASNHHGWQWVAGTGTDAVARTSACSTRSARASATTPTATTCAAGCPSCGAVGGRAVHRAVDAARRATRRVSADRSSTTPTSGPRPSAATTPSAPDPRPSVPDPEIGRPDDRSAGKSRCEGVGPRGQADAGPGPLDPPSGRSPRRRASASASDSTSRRGTPARRATRAASSCSTLTRPGLTFTRTGRPSTSTVVDRRGPRPALEGRAPHAERAGLGGQRGRDLARPAPGRRGR